MKVDTNVSHTLTFSHVTNGECFTHGGKQYLKFSEFINLSSKQKGVDGATQDIRGYNCVRLEDGRPGSFKDHTKVVPKELMVVSVDHG